MKNKIKDKEIYGNIKKEYAEKYIRSKIEMSKEIGVSPKMLSMCFI